MKNNNHLVLQCLAIHSERDKKIPIIMGFLDGSGLVCLKDRSHFPSI